MPSNPRFPSLALLGTGYIGGSAALAARRAGLVGRVVGYDRNPAAAAAAQRLGVLDAVAPDAQKAVDGAALVMLAAPVASLPPLLSEVARSVGIEATVVDVGSVKGAVVAAAESLLPDGQFVGCHPMAGAEFSGVEAANGDIYPGRICYLCPARNTRASAVSAARDFWGGIGCQPVAIEPAIHDRLVAAQSHLPHVAAFALAAALAPAIPFLEEHQHALGPNASLRDTTRVAASGPSVWRDILLANAGYLLPLIDELETCVQGIKDAVRAGDGQELERILGIGQTCRRRLVKP